MGSNWKRTSRGRAVYEPDGIEDPSVSPNSSCTDAIAFVASAPSPPLMLLLSCVTNGSWDTNAHRPPPPFPPDVDAAVVVALAPTTTSSKSPPSIASPPPIVSTSSVPSWPFPRFSLLTPSTNTLTLPAQLLVVTTPSSSLISAIRSRMPMSTEPLGDRSL